MKTDYTAAVAKLTRRDPPLRRLVRVVGPCTMGQGRTRRPHFAERPFRHIAHSRSLLSPWVSASILWQGDAPLKRLLRGR